MRPVRSFALAFALPLLTFLLLASPRPARAENIVFPADSGALDVTKAPYNAKGDGVTDDTAAIQAALLQAPNARKIIYLPNGTYSISTTLTWPLGNNVYGFTTLQGQSAAGVILKLKNAVFTDAAHPKAVVLTGVAGSADRFQNSIRNLTIDTGTGNPGAVGLQFFSNNSGSARDLLIRSGDGQGVAGLDMEYNDQDGPLLVKNLTVNGFAIGVKTGNSVNSQTFEHIHLQNQTAFGFRNNGQCVSIRDLTYAGPAPAVNNIYGVMVLVDATLNGTGAASTQPAVANGEALFARNVVTTGYALAIQNNSGGTASANGPNVAQFVSTPILNQFRSFGRSLGLPVLETPDVAWDDPATWANVRTFGAVGDGPATDIQYRGGDGFGYDGAAWANVRVIAADNTVKHLAGDFNYNGGTRHTLAPDELGWYDASFQYAYVQIDRSAGGNGIALRGQTYARGIGTPQPSAYKFHLNGAYKTFASDIGVDDDTNGNGSLQFEVWVDGQRKYNSFMMYGNTPAKSVSLDVTNAQELEIRITDGQDDTAYIQAAIDSGASTIYFPNGTYTLSDTVLIRGNVRRIIGCEATINILTKDGKPGFKFVDGAAPVVVMERLGTGYNTATFLEHAATRTLVLKDCALNGVKGTGTGDFYFEDVVCGPLTLGRQRVWARQLNVENEGTHILNSGGTFWLLGYKTERGGTLIDTEAGGKTELLGGLSYTTTDPGSAPMFVSADSAISLAFGEVCYTGKPFGVLVTETQKGVTKTLSRGQAPLRFSFLQGSVLPLYVGYALNVPPLQQIKPAPVRATPTKSPRQHKTNAKGRRT